MQLYLLRHGEAAVASADGQRPLTSRGVSDTRQVIERVAADLGDVQTIYTSPKLRARQTAAIAGGIIGRGLAPVETDTITPGGDIHQLGAFLEQRGETAVLLTTHQPFVGKLLGYLTDHPGPGLEIGASCLACLELMTFSRGCAALQWLERP